MAKIAELNEEGWRERVATRPPGAGLVPAIPARQAVPDATDRLARNVGVVFGERDCDRSRERRLEPDDVLARGFRR